MILVFLVDTSASMNQRTSFGMTLLDCAKAAIEHFHTRLCKENQLPHQQGHKYMLVTLEEGCGAVRAGWRDSLEVFLEEVKNLKAVDMTCLGDALKTSFDLLNLNRLQQGRDNYGMGRQPLRSAPAAVILFTDNGNVSTLNGVKNEVCLGDEDDTLYI
tara:strand:- start:74 stop:547 length:474 start_codon:yes stop_codon:yes gene_type:complete